MPTWMCGGIRIPSHRILLGPAPHATHHHGARMCRLREIYTADREIGDMSLSSITQFVYRKLG